MSHSSKSNSHSFQPSPADRSTTGQTTSGKPAGQSASGQFSAARWLAQSIVQEGIRVRSQLRGNDLHLLCETETISPDRYTVLSKLIHTLRDTDLDLLTPAGQPKIYRIRLYGCVTGYNRPSWTELVELNQLDRYVAQLQEISRSLEVFESIQSELTAEPAVPPPPPFTPADIALSNRTLAQQGDVNAIAAYLSETLSEYGVAVQVSVKTLTYTPTSTIYGWNTGNAPDTQTSKRLWIACQAAYSPEPSFISEPIAQKLRDLEIEGFRDAVILFQVTGETRPDWMLRVNLTPALEMLKEWARWGDVMAIQRLLSNELADLQLQIGNAFLNEATLHLICTELASVLEQVDRELVDRELVDRPVNSRTLSTVVQHHEAAKTRIVTLLEAIAPQGIHAASVFGQLPDEENPAWMDWYNLPASIHAALADPPLMLAQQNDWGAIAFLLHRLLNPDLDKYLATGGIRIQLLPKQNFLHLMCEAAICPEQREITPQIIQLLEQLRIPHLEGLRIYGRRAGQKHPLWNYAHNFNSNQSQAEQSSPAQASLKAAAVTEATPDFAATDAYVDELLAKDGEPILRPDLTTDDVKGAWQRSQQRLVESIRWVLVRSQLFAHQPIDQSVAGTAAKGTVKGTLTQGLPGEVSYRGVGTGLVWSAVGLLLMVQTNWALASWVNTAKLTEAQQQQERERQVAAALTPAAAAEPAPQASPNSANGNPVSAGTSGARSPQAASPQQSADQQSSNSQLKVSLRQSPNTDPNAFNNSGFTRPDSEPEKGSFAFSAEVDTTESGDRPSSLPYTPETQKSRLETVEILTKAQPLPTFNSHQLDEKLQLYYQFLQESGRPDVMIVGSSRALRGVDPIALQKALADHGYKDAKIFNFGINGATVQVVDVLLRRVLQPNQLPRLIVWADGARAFNSGTKDVTYDGIVASDAYRQLMAGTLALPTVPTDTATAATPATTPTLNTTLTQSYQSLDRWLSQQVGGIITVHQERDRLKNLFQQQFAQIFPAEGETAIAAPSLDNRQDLLAKVQQGQPIVNPQGFLSLSVQFNPATYYQKFAKVSGRYDSDYSDFRVSGVQANALNSFLDYTRSQNIPVVFVNLPLTDKYLDPVRSQYEEQFRQYLVGVSVKQPGLIFRDFGELWTEQHQYFSDPSHLNRYGAYAVSYRLAQDPIIPWGESQVRSTEGTDP